MVRFYTPNLDEACDALDLYDIDSTSTTIWMMATALWWTILSTMMLSTHSMSMTLSTRRCKHVAP